MTRLLKFCFWISLFFIGGFSFGKFQHKIQTISHFQKTLSNKFKPNPYPIENQSFVIIVIGYNNGANVEKTMRSIFSQNYENFRVIYIDDGSTDGSLGQAQNVINESNQAGRVSIKQNMESLGVCNNLRQMTNFCHPEEIIVVVDGNDLLAHEWVLQKLNQYYADPDLWMTVNAYLEYPSFLEKKVPSDWISNPDPQLPLQTFYASLLTHLQDETVSSMLPLLQIAEGHIQQIEEILYLVTTKEKED